MFDLESFGRNQVVGNVNGRTVDYGMNIGQGFYSSSQIWADQKLFFLIDTCSKIVRKDTALNAIKKLGKKDAIEEELVGYSVMASYSNKRNYIVTGIDFKKNPKSTFDCQGQQMTYIDYYKKKYNIKIQDTE